MPRHLRISSRVRPQLTHNSLLSWQSATQGFSMSLAMAGSGCGRESYRVHHKLPQPAEKILRVGQLVG